MTDYGRGGVLGAITLPATSAALLFVEHTHPVIVWGFLAVSVLSWVVLMHYMVNFLLNRKSN